MNIFNMLRIAQAMREMAPCHTGVDRWAPAELLRVRVDERPPNVTAKTGGTMSGRYANTKDLARHLKADVRAVAFSDTVLVPNTECFKFQQPFNIRVSDGPRDRTLTAALIFTPLTLRFQTCALGRSGRQPRMSVRIMIV